MAVTQYIGSRYVPLLADPAEWSSENTYEALTIVLHEGNSYTSRQAVPKGIDISNEDYWARTGNYNAQVEQYRNEVVALGTSVLKLEDALPASAFETSTVKDAIDATSQSVTDLTEHVSEKFAQYVKQVDTFAELIGTTEDYVLVLRNDSPLGNNMPCLFEKVPYSEGTYLRSDGSHMAAAIGRSCNYDGNAPSIALTNTAASYLRRNELSYGQGHGLFNSSVQMEIDCSSFVWACLGGITYENSRYVRGSASNNLYGPYVGKNRISTDNTPYPNYIGALPTYWSVEYFAEQGQLFAFEDGDSTDVHRRNVEKLQYGDILFSGSGSYPNHLYEIDHCMIVLETFPNDGAVLIAEAGGAPNTIKRLENTNCKRALVNVSSYSGPDKPYKFFARPSYGTMNEEVKNIGNLLYDTGVKEGVSGSTSVVLGRMMCNEALVPHKIYSCICEGDLPSYTTNGAFLYISAGGLTVGTMWHIDVYDKAIIMFMVDDEITVRDNIAIVANCADLVTGETTFELKKATVCEGAVDMANLCVDLAPYIVNKNENVTFTTLHAFVTPDNEVNVFLDFTSTVTGDVTLFTIQYPIRTVGEHFPAYVGDSANNQCVSRFTPNDEYKDVKCVIPSAYTSGRIRTYMRCR